MSITFETKVYEEDWKFLLKDGFLDEQIKRCHHNFNFKNIIINNVDDPDQVTFFAERAKKKGIIDNYYLAKELEKEVLDFFSLTIDSFEGGYYYSIAELIGIYVCKTDYLLHFSSDSFLDSRPEMPNWIDEAIVLMERNPDILVANPTWNHNFLGAFSESIGETGNFFTGYGFSDQCYLIRPEEFKKNIYNEKNLQSERYPKYGGELFEKRVDAYMRNMDRKRLTSKNVSYIHKNFPRKTMEKFIYRMFPGFHKLIRFKS